MTVQDLEQLLLERRAGQGAIEQVRPIEGSDKLDRVFQLELRRDVAAHACRGGGRVCVKADAWQQLPQTAKLPVLRAEIVTPLADAVRFIDGHEAHAGRRNHRKKTVAAVADEALGRDVEQ